MIRNLYKEAKIIRVFSQIESKMFAAILHAIVPLFLNPNLA